MLSTAKTVVLPASPERVFAQLDDSSKAGMHMSESSMMMMGSKLRLEQLSAQAAGPGATYRWYGKMMGLTIDFQQTITHWEPPRRKRWETIGEARIIIMRWYRMGFDLEPVENGTSVTLFIEYERPRHWFYRTLSLLFAPWYCRWCLNSMLRDARQALEPVASTA
jgi:hypothetical protein